MECVVNSIPSRAKVSAVLCAAELTIALVNATGQARHQRSFTIFEGVAAAIQVAYHATEATWTANTGRTANFSVISLTHVLVSRREGTW